VIDLINYNTTIKHSEGGGRGGGCTVRGWGEREGGEVID